MYGVVRSRPEYDGAIIKVRVDTVMLPDGSLVEREVVEHVGSVAVVAIDASRRVLLIRQYRHPAGGYLWELPAGLCDRPGEEPVDAARRELAEETGVVAGAWSTLVDVRPSPGISTEACRVYQAGQLSQGPRIGGEEGEERDLRSRWSALPEAVDDVLAGRITTGLAVAGLLAAAVRNGLANERARPADSRWPRASR